MNAGLVRESLERAPILGFKILSFDDETYIRDDCDRVRTATISDLKFVSL